MILLLQLGIVSYFIDFLPFPHVKKDYSMHFYFSPCAVFCDVLEQYVPFFSLYKHCKGTPVLQGVSQSTSPLIVWVVMIS